jgi:predicted transcriptional regulator
MSEMLTKKEAAELLGVSTRTVETYIGRSMLTRFTQGRKTMLMRAQVVELAADREAQTGSLLNRKTILDLQRRVLRLEANLRLLTEIHEISLPPLQLEPSECKAMLEMAQHALSNLTIGDAQNWVDLFPRMDETVFHTIHLATKFETPELVFLKLCMGLQALVRERDGYDTNLEVQKLHSRLEFCRKHLRGAVIIYVETYRDEAVRDHFLGLDGPGLDPKGDLLSILRKNRT